MIHESQVTPTLLNGTNPPTVTRATVAEGLNKAWGIVQWYPAKKMITASRSKGVSYETIETLEYQLKFLKEQLDGTGPVALKAVGDKMKATKTVEDAAYRLRPRLRDLHRSTTTTRSTTSGRRPPGRSSRPTPARRPSRGSRASGRRPNARQAAATSPRWRSRWPGRQDRPRAGTRTRRQQAYQAALPKCNSENGFNVWSDCGRFVATVMRMSGADPEYPMVSTGTQNTYLRTSGKYDVFDNIADGRAAARRHLHRRRSHVPVRRTMG